MRGELIGGRKDENGPLTGKNLANKLRRSSQMFISHMSKHSSFSSSNLAMTTGLKSATFGEDYINNMFSNIRPEKSSAKATLEVEANFGDDSLSFDVSTLNIPSSASPLKKRVTNLVKEPVAVRDSNAFRSTKTMNRLRR